MHADEVAAIADRYPQDAGDFRLFLYHFPDAVEEASAANIDLYLAGHTHGGQVRLPFYGALITFSRYDKRYEAGLYRLGAATMYVNRGIGMEGGKAPRVRFLDRPEITVIDVAPK
jgi:predicted MPP superfamily phosphohydrolase